MNALAARVAWTARTQYGRVTYKQLIAAGVDRNRITRWVADGRLRREHRGVFALGHPDRSPRGECMSAVLAAGSTAVASHGTAGYLLKILPTLLTPLEVTIAVSSGRKRKGITIHRSSLHPLDHNKLDGIPITTVPRILLDLAPRLSVQRLSRACHEAWVHYETSPAQIEACIARNRHKPGARKLRQALGTDVTLSGLEHAFLVLLDSHELPRPRTNIDHKGDKVDCRWPDLDVTIELLSYRYHATRHAFEVDVARRRRSNHHAYTYGDVIERAARTAAELAVLLRTS